jgi:hypothetical protein
MTNQIQKPAEENFESFVNITRLTLRDDRGWKTRFSKWTREDQNYLEFVRNSVEGIIRIHSAEDNPFTERERIELCQYLFEKLYGLNVYVAWGAWAEGYFDKFAQRVKAYDKMLKESCSELENDDLPF